MFSGNELPTVPSILYQSLGRLSYTGINGFKINDITLIFLVIFALLLALKTTPSFDENFNSQIVFGDKKKTRFVLLPLKMFIFYFVEQHHLLLFG